MKRSLVILLAAFAAVLLLLTAAGSIGRVSAQQSRAQLETALRRAAVACYALEGVYPPDVAFLQQHYGIQIDTHRFVVDYEIFAENLMPNITVLEREP